MKKRKSGKAFEAVNLGGRWTVVHSSGSLVFEAESKSGAERIATALNVALRAETFKPKSAGGRARRKGHQFERDVAILLRPIFPKARRHLEYQDAEANGVDLVETGVFRFQCKKLKAYASVNTIEEVQADRSFGEIPVLVTAADGKEAVAVLPLTDLIHLIGVSKYKGI